MKIFKGYKHKGGLVHFRDIMLDDLRAVFFPKNFHEKYKYLGAVPWKESGSLFKAIEPLVIFMDYKAKPKWCPRWFLRFLHLFGMDGSLVRVRNRKMADLFHKLTKRYSIRDYKTKWTDYDLRISITGSEQAWFLADSIEREYYDRGLREDLADRIKALDPDTKHHKGNTPDYLRKELDRLEEKKDNKPKHKKKGK